LKTSNKKKEFERGINKIYDKIDAVYLIRKIMEIEKLKLLLLSPPQLKLFENLPRPKIFSYKGGYSNEQSNLNH
jgi:hypothetical protein